MYMYCLYVCIYIERERARDIDRSIDIWATAGDHLLQDAGEPAKSRPSQALDRGFRSLDREIGRTVSSHSFTSQNANLTVSNPRNHCLGSLQNALWRFKSPRGWAHFSRLNFWKLAASPPFSHFPSLPKHQPCEHVSVRHRVGHAELRVAFTDKLLKSGRVPCGGACRSSSVSRSSVSRMPLLPEAGSWVLMRTVRHASAARTVTTRNYETNSNITLHINTLTTNTTSTTIQQQ